MVLEAAALKLKPLVELGWAGVELEPKPRPAVGIELADAAEPKLKRLVEEG